MNITGGAFKMTSLPARHFSGRRVTNRFETLWGSCVFKGESPRVFYGPDSGWWEGFAEIGAAYGPFDLTMLEIGAFNELWKDIHMGPDGAARRLWRWGAGTRRAADADSLGAVRFGAAWVAATRGAPIGDCDGARVVFVCTRAGGPTEICSSGAIGLVAKIGSITPIIHQQYRLLISF